MLSAVSKLSKDILSTCHEISTWSLEGKQWKYDASMMPCWKWQKGNEGCKLKRRLFQTCVIWTFIIVLVCRTHLYICVRPLSCTEYVGGSRRCIAFWQHKPFNLTTSCQIYNVFCFLDVSVYYTCTFPL
jgi:hypothetical protein